MRLRKLPTWAFKSTILCWLNPRKGFGWGKKPKEAFAWYMKGAERGYYRSQNRVGQAYEAGDLVKRDFNWQ